MAKEQFSVRIPPDILQQIDELATKEHRTRNNMTEVLILKGLEVMRLRENAEREALELAIQSAVATEKKPASLNESKTA